LYKFTKLNAIMAEKKKNDSMKWMSMAYEMGASIGICVFLGWKGDALWDTKPWLTLLGSLLGVGGSMYLLIKKAFRK
jgi:F0F1-type ATP synthase assembly protein I